MSGPPWGVVPTGFQPEPTADVVSDLEAAHQTAFGASIDLSPDGVFGQFIGIVGDRLGDLWAGLQAVYSCFDPDAASDAALDALCAITGVLRLPATYSSVLETLVGTNGTTVNAGTLLAVAGLSSPPQFSTQANATIATLTAWSASQTWVANQLVQNGGNVYFCTKGGAGAVGGGGPTGTGSAIADNLAVWGYIAAGTAAVNVECLATVTGPITAVADTLKTIVTPVAGLTSVNNALDAQLGANVETDAALRVRREKLLRQSGNAALLAIEAAILNVGKGTDNPVTSCTVYENPTDATDGNGLLPHSIEALVTGGVDQDIAQAIFNSKAAGINTNGSTTKTVVDSQGVSHSISFQRPTAVPIYIIIDLNYLTSEYPTGAGGGTPGDTLVKQGLVAFGDTFGNGQNVISSQLGAQIFGDGPNAVAGVIDVTALYIGTAPAPGTQTPIVISAFQIATFSTANITVNSTPGTT